MVNEVVDINSYVSLTQTLDAFRDLALTEFALIELDHKKDAAKSAEETRKFAEFVLDVVRGFRRQIAVDHQQEWLRLNPIRAKQFNDHIASLSEPKSAICPPGFHEVGGVCVRI